MNSKNKLNRFTTLPVLLDILINRRLVLLDPESWPDRNDSKTLVDYKKRQNLEKLFALCFAECSETIHHWNSYADGISGCCIEFNKEKLKKHLSNFAGLRFESVDYKTFEQLESGCRDDQQTPFTKRWAYHIEDEFRVIWESKKSNLDCYIIDGIDLEIIQKITFSQKMPEPIFQTVQSHLVNCFHISKEKINHSTILENQVWIAHFGQHS
jgi:hypothetical protein